MSHEDVAHHHGLESAIDRKLKGSFDEKTVDRVSSGEGGDLTAATTTHSIPSVQQPEVLEDEYPDGGLQAWLVIFGVVDLEIISSLLLIPVYR